MPATSAVTVFSRYADRQRLLSEADPIAAVAADDGEENGYSGTDTSGHDLTTAMETVVPAMAVIAPGNYDV